MQGGGAGRRRRQGARGRHRRPARRDGGIAAYVNVPQCALRLLVDGAEPVQGARSRRRADAIADQIKPSSTTSTRRRRAARRRCGWPAARPQVQMNWFGDVFEEAHQKLYERPLPPSSRRTSPRTSSRRRCSASAARTSACATPRRGGDPHRGRDVNLPGVGVIDKLLQGRQRKFCSVAGIRDDDVLRHLRRRRQGASRRSTARCSRRRPVQVLLRGRPQPVPGHEGDGLVPRPEVHLHLGQRRRDRPRRPRL